MKLGFIIPHHTNEKRVGLLPEHINNFKNEIFIENGFGETLGISNDEYVSRNCTILSRKEIFSHCDTVFSLKLIKEEDYKYIRPGQIILGWTHPNGSGKDFMKDQAIPKSLIVVDLDNIYPSVYYKGEVIPIPWIKPNFVMKNSFIAGYSSTLHGIMSYGSIPNSDTKIAILGSGNVSQGAFQAASKFSPDIIMFYRKTMAQFKEQLQNFDIIINGIEMDDSDVHILTIKDQKKLKKGCLVIDAAADVGKTIEGNKNTTFTDPLYSEKGVYYYGVNNSPSIFYRESSKYISEAFSENVYSKDTQIFLDLIKNKNELSSKVSYIQMESSLI